MIWEMFLRRTFQQQCRNSRPTKFFKISVLIRFPILTRKYMFESFSNKVTILKGCNFIKKGPQNRCFPVNITQCLRIKCVTRGGRGGGLTCTFSKIGKKCPNFEGKCPDRCPLWVRFLIWNVILKNFQAEKSLIFTLQGFSFLCCRWLFIKGP